MAVTEDFEGFVPIVVYVAGHRVEGKVWKFANRRLLQQLEEDKRQLLPVVEAKLSRLPAELEQKPVNFDVLAVNKAQIVAVEPKDTVSARSKR